MIEKNYYTREQWSLNRNRSQKVLLTWHATISRIHRSTNERQSSHENAPSFNASHKVTFLLFLPVSSTLPNFSPSTNRQTEWNQNKCTRITRKKTHERDGHGPSPRGSTQFLLLRRPLKRRYRLGVLIFSRLVTRLAKTIKQTSSEREREKERKERIKFSNEQKEKKKKKNNKIKSTITTPYYPLSESFEEREKEGRKDRSSKMIIDDDGIGEKMIEAQLVLEAQYGKTVQRFFPPSLSPSLSMSVLSISRCGCVENFTRTMSFITKLVVSHANARRWRKSDRAVCRLFEAESEYVCHGCVFSEPVRHPSRRSAGH